MDNFIIKNLFLDGFFIFQKLENLFVEELLDFAINFALKSFLTILLDYKTCSAGKRVRPLQASWITWVIRMT